MKNNPAIVIGLDNYNTLGVVRSLGEKNVPVILILVGTQKSFVRHSRYVTKAVYSKCTICNGSGLYQIIKNEILQLPEKPVLFPLADISVKVIDNNFREITNISYTSHLHGNIDKFQDKLKMGQLAAEYGLFVPEKEIIFSGKDCEWNIVPAILKPSSGLSGLKSDISIVKDIVEFDRALKLFEEKQYDQVLVEKYISGNDEHLVEILGYVKKNGEIIISGIVKKIRDFPLNRGNTSYAEFVKEQDGLDIIKLKEFIKSTGFYGIFDIEFKYADKNLYFIEINFRNGASSYALTMRNCNLIYNWYRDALDLPPSGNIRCLSGKYMCEQIDFLHIFERNVTFREWINEYNDKQCQKIFSNKRDKKPNMVYWKNFVIDHIILRLKI
jgi:predicted ATP-grasp superfamily ATP-dependent carboligase